jgi:hypothetical protein
LQEVISPDANSGIANRQIRVDMGLPVPAHEFFDSIPIAHQSAAVFSWRRCVM